MKALFFIAFAAYAVSVILEFSGTAFRKKRLLRAAWIAFLAAFALHSVFLVARGVAAKRLPLSNQFEFANGFAWGVALFTVAVCTRLKTDWLKVAAMPAALLIMTYAALQPMEIRDLMPASYRLVSFGFLFLTVVILSGAIWAEQAWSAFWTWDPKEVWALICWILYAVYLHLRLRGKKKGRQMAWYLVIAVFVVFFTFAGVNTLLHGLHTYG